MLLAHAEDQTLIDKKKWTALNKYLEDANLQTLSYVVTVGVFVSDKLFHYPLLPPFKHLGQTVHLLKQKEVNGEMRFDTETYPEPIKISLPVNDRYFNASSLQDRILEKQCELILTPEEASDHKKRWTEAHKAFRVLVDFHKQRINATVGANKNVLYAQ